MYKVRFFWGNEQYKSEAELKTLVTKRFINPPKLVHDGEGYVLLEELSAFRDEALARKRHRNAQFLKETRIIFPLVLLYFFFVLFFDFDYYKLAFTLAMGLIFVAIPSLECKQEGAIITKLAARDARFVPSYRTAVEWQSRKSYLAMAAIPILIALPPYAVTHNGIADNEFWSALFIHNSLLHWLFNVASFIWCIKLVEGKLGTLLALAVVFVTLLCHYLTYIYWPFEAYGNGLSAVVFSLFALVVVMTYQAKIAWLFKQYLLNLAIFTAASMLIPQYLSVAAHLVGFIIGLGIFVLMLPLQNGSLTKVPQS